jgi:hypothetical protein
MRRIANISHGLGAVLISLAVAAVAATEPLAAWASQGSPGGF